MRELSEPAKVVLNSVDSMMQVLMTMLGECENSRQSWTAVEFSCQNSIDYLNKRIDGINWELGVFREYREKILAGIDVKQPDVVS